MNRVCESNATWSGDEPLCKRKTTLNFPSEQPDTLCFHAAVDCGHPGSPSNGEAEVSTTTFESEVYYTCDRGYNIDGMTRRFCQANGTWSGRLPSCQSM